MYCTVLYCTALYGFYLLAQTNAIFFIHAQKFTGKSQDTGDKGKAAESTSATTKVAIRQHYRLTMNIIIKLSCHFDYDYAL